MATWTTEPFPRFLAAARKRHKLTLMKSKKPETKPDTSAGESPATAQAALAQVGFLDADALLERLPISRGTLRNWMKKGSIPYIRTGGRRILFDWASVREALPRRQRTA